MEPFFHLATLFLGRCHECVYTCLQDIADCCLDSLFVCEGVHGEPLKTKGRSETIFFESFFVPAVGFIPCLFWPKVVVEDVFDGFCKWEAVFIAFEVGETPEPNLWKSIKRLIDGDVDKQDGSFWLICTLEGERKVFPLPGRGFAQYRLNGGGPTAPTVEERCVAVLAVFESMCDQSQKVRDILVELGEDVERLIDCFHCLLERLCLRHTSKLLCAMCRRYLRQIRLRNCSTQWEQGLRLL